MAATLSVAGLALSGCNVTNLLGSVAEEEAPKTRVTAAFVQAQDPQAPIGKKEHPTVVAANGGAYEDERLESLLAVVVAELVAAAPPSSDAVAHAYRVTILDSETVNAFALPGGYLYVTRGLIALANDASEIAAVLAHEMAHVDASHGVERIEATRATDIAARVASQVVSNGAAGALAKASSGQKLASFSQRQELEADHLGIARAARAGFDPDAARRFLQQMRRWGEYRKAGAASGMLATHPSTPERLQLAAAHATRLRNDAPGLALRERYLEGVDGLVFGSRPENGMVRGRNYAHKGLGVAFAVPEGFAVKRKGAAAIATGPGETALRFDAVPRLEAQASSVRDYLTSGWVNGIDEASIQTAERAGMDLATASASAGAFDFAVAVFADEENFYRFITAAPKGSRGLAKASRTISGSFRALSNEEREKLAPLRIRAVDVKEGDSVATLARRMAVGGEALFRTLNGLDPESGIEAGSKVKVVAAD